jgi:hypothetical protein
MSLERWLRAPHNRFDIVAGLIDGILTALTLLFRKLRAEPLSKEHKRLLQRDPDAPGERQAYRQPGENRRQIGPAAPDAAPPS